MTGIRPMIQYRHRITALVCLLATLPGWQSVQAWPQSPLTARAVALFKNRQYEDSIRLLLQDVEGKSETQVNHAAKVRFRLSNQRDRFTRTTESSTASVPSP